MSCDGSAYDDEMRAMGMVDLPVNSVVEGTRTHCETRSRSQTRRRQTCVSRTMTRLTALMFRNDRGDCRAIRVAAHGVIPIFMWAAWAAWAACEDAVCPLPCDPLGQGRRVVSTKHSTAPPTSTASVGKRGDQSMQLGNVNTTVEVQP